MLPTDAREIVKLSFIDNAMKLYEEGKTNYPLQEGINVLVSLTIEMPVAPFEIRYDVFDRVTSMSYRDDVGVSVHILENLSRLIWDSFVNKKGRMARGDFDIFLRILCRDKLRNAQGSI